MEGAFYLWLVYDKFIAYFETCLNISIFIWYTALYCYAEATYFRFWDPGNRDAQAAFPSVSVSLSFLKIVLWEVRH